MVWRMHDPERGPSTAARRCALVIACGLVLSAPLRSEGAIPSDELLERLQPTGDMNDFAGALSPSDREAITERCRRMRDKTGAGFVIVILDSLQGGQIDDFTNKLYNKWGIGQQGENKGLLLLVALKDRKARLEVGYGLEPIIPDALAGRILEEQLFPEFKRQRYGEGLKAAVERAASLVEKGEPAKPEDLRRPWRRIPIGQQILMSLFLALFVLIGFFLFGAGLGSKAGALLLCGLFFGGVPYGMGWMLALPLAPILHTPLAIIMTILGVRAGRRAPGSFRPHGNGQDIGSWTWQNIGGSGSSSSWGGGGFSMDLGSFGGGSSGGGGASGGW